MFKIDARKPEDLELYKKIEAANRSGDCMFDIIWSNDGNQFFFHSIGFFPTGGSVVWKIIDGNGTVIQTQSGFSTLNYLIPTNTTYPVSVSIESEGCTPHVEIIAQSPPNAGYNCNTFTFDYAFSGNSSQLVINITIPANTPTVYWDFDGNGNTDLTTPPTGNSSGNVSHTYPDDDGLTEYTICATVQTEECTNTVCKNIGAVGCGIENKKFRQKAEYFVGVQGYKARLGLKNPLFSKSRIFLKLKHYNVHGIVWIKEKTDRLAAFLDASGNNSLGDLRYFSPVSNGGCTGTEEIAIGDQLSVKKLLLERKLNDNSTIRKADLACECIIRETVTGVPLPPGITNPLTFPFRIGY